MEAALAVTQITGRSLKDVDGARGNEGDDGEGDDRLQHGGEFCRARQNRGVGRRESGAGVEGEEQVINEVGGPARNIPVAAARHLRKKKGTLGLGIGVLAAKRAAAVEFPIPKGEHEDVSDPQSDGGAKKRFGRFGVLGNAFHEVNERSDHGEGNDGIGGESERARDLVIATAVRDHDRNHQNENDGEKPPARADRKRFGKCEVDTGGG